MCCNIQKCRSAKDCMILWVITLWTRSALNDVRTFNGPCCMSLLHTTIFFTENHTISVLFFFFSRHSQQRFRNRLSLVEPATASSHRTCQHFRLYGCQVQGGFDRTIDAALETKKLNRWYFWSIWSKATVVAVAVCLPDEFLLQQTNCKMDSDK